MFPHLSSSYGRISHAATLNCLRTHAAEESMPVCWLCDYFVYLCFKIPTGTNTKLESKMPAITNDKVCSAYKSTCNKVIPPTWLYGCLSHCMTEAFHGEVMLGCHISNGNEAIPEHHGRV